MADTDTLDKPLEVQIPAEQAPAAPAPGTPAEVKVEPKPAEPGINELKAQIAALQARNEERDRQFEETQRIAREREQENFQWRQQAQRHEGELTDSRYQNILNTIDGARRDTEIAKRDQAAALAAGNFEGFAEAQQRVSRAEAQIVQLESYKYTLEQQGQQQRQQAEWQAQQAQQPRSQTPSERFEEYVGQFSPRSQAYLRSHPEYATDSRLNSRLLRAHGEAVEDEGIIPDTDAYFQFLDQRMAPVTQRSAAVPGRRAPAAPVSRQPVNGSSLGGGGSVILSPAEREAARMSGISDIEYAKQMLALEAIGQIVRH